MRIRLGRRGDYAVRATLQLARAYGGERQKARQIAAAMAIPETFLPQILGALVHAEIVTSTAGPGGGYTLSRPPEEISMLDVVTAVGEAPKSTECVLTGGPCHWETACAVHEPWTRAQQAMMDELAATSFAFLAEEDARLEDLSKEQG